MEWTQSETIALAKEGCAECNGFGLTPRKKLKLLRRQPQRPRQPCNCVLRRIFRACYDQFRHCSTKEKFMSNVSLSRPLGRKNRHHYERLDEDYAADFFLVSRRTLSEFDWTLFRLHFLLGAASPVCCKLLKIARGDFYRAVYRIQQQLGRVFRELEPYGLFPLDEYFGGTFSRKRLDLGAMPPRSHQLQTSTRARIQPQNPAKQRAARGE